MSYYLPSLDSGLPPRTPEPPAGTRPMQAGECPSEFDGSPQSATQAFGTAMAASGLISEHPDTPQFTNVPISRSASDAGLWQHARSLSGEDDPPRDLIRALIAFRVAGESLPTDVDPAELVAWFAPYVSTWVDLLFHGYQYRKLVATEPFGWLDSERIKVQLYRWKRFRENPDGHFLVPHPKFPAQGCPYCGLGIQRVPHRAGHVINAFDVWHKSSFSPSAVGARGAGTMELYFCQDCARAVREVGAVGAGSVEAALIGFLAGEPAGKRAAVELKAQWREPGTVIPVWAGLGAKTPNTEPWGHLSLKKSKKLLTSLQLIRE